jgi:hypothetical protein
MGGVAIAMRLAPRSTTDTTVELRNRPDAQRQGKQHCGYEASDARGHNRTLVEADQSANQAYRNRSRQLVGGTHPIGFVCGID